MSRVVAMSGLAALLAAVVSACGSSSPTSVAQSSTAQSQGNGGAGSTSSQGGGAGSLSVSGARNATLLVKLNGNECDSGKGGVSTSGSALNATFDWGDITATTTTTFPGQKDPRTGGVTAGAYVVLNDVIKGGQWYATSGTLTMSGDASSPQVSVDVNAVRVEDRSQVHISGSFHC